MVRKVLAVLAALLVLLPVPLQGPAAAAPAASRVTYDHHSLMIDGRRVVVQAAEIHYFRLPSPGLWRDVLEKIRAGGFNAVSVYFDWAYHSPKPGVYDFTGVRDVDRFLRTAERAGLYVVARPGPYINAETTGGGFPGWLKNVPGRGRSSDPGFTEAYRDWLHHINPIIARHQVGRGGSVILYNAENEYAANTDAAYMQDIQDQARADGIDVPITTNDCCDAADWTSTWATGPGAVQMPGVDDYPQSFDCPNAETVWGPWGEGVTERLRDDAPVFAAEYQAGSIDLENAGYERCRALTGPAYMKYFYKSNLMVSGATLFNYYMGFGGTNWGFLAQPNDVYTSYDYGAALTEARQPTTKYDEFKRQGYFLQSVAPLAKTDPAAAPTTDNPAIGVVARTNPDTGTRFALVRHADRAATTTDAATLSWTVPDGTYALPVQVAGRDAHVLVGAYDLGGQRLAASSSEIMTHAHIGGRDVAVLYGTAGSPGATILRYPAKPQVRVLEGDVRWAFAGGDLRLDYTHRGLARVLVSGGGRRPLLLLLGTDETAATFWRAGTDAAPVLVRGTSLVRSAAVEGGTVRLTADTAQAGEVEVFADVQASRLRLAGGAGDTDVRVTRTPSGSLLGRVPGPREAARLPALTGWRVHDEAPEAAPGFDDSSWRTADRTTTESPMKPKAGPVLYADDYGFHYGDVWYRGRFTATGAETTVALNAITGRRGRYLVWLDGRYLGSAAGGTQADVDAANPDPGPGRFTVPAGLLKPGRTATLAVLVQNMGHNDDWTADDNRFKQPRGLVAASVEGSPATVAWKIQGARGGEDLTDPVRGPLNTGGLYGERSGWHLPGYPDRSWKEVAAPAARPLAPGVTWYRTEFGLDLPGGQDVSVGLRFGGAVPAGSRTMVYLNGWNIGQYGGDIGPQKEFVLPAGLLREHGRNTLALAVTSTAAATGGPGPIGLFAYGAVRGGVPVPDVPGPSYPLTR
ncbi:beta-galactosidase [Microbispora amethystogenes]|uniref:beta-galactosidase n=1 Tax=Microbispora amethystogenes TaxID=1427754 RepID=A0ABQ4F8T3_9ACTN|nr:beta-galactosidase [Microbispora amethystogenes]GIH31236.1 beta-galactosidase [Microbispora amethystogenes]